MAARGRRLEQDLKDWVAEGLIRQEQAEAIRARCAGGRAGFPWGAVIFSSLGAVIVGLGVILLLAYNWQAMPRFAKLGLVLAALAASHGAGMGLWARGGRSRGLGEGLVLLGTMLFGAGIWLVAQIYHIEEHFPNGFLLWGAGAAALAWAMPSVAQGVLAAVLLAVWSGVETLAYQDAAVWRPLLLAAVLGPLAYRERSRLLTAVLTPALIAALLIARTAHSRNGEDVLPLLFHTAALLIALSFLARRHGRFPDCAPVLGAYGWGVFLALLYAGTFHGLTEQWQDWMPGEPPTAHGSDRWAILGLALAAWLAVGYHAAVERGGRLFRRVAPESILVPLTAPVWEFLVFRRWEPPSEWIVPGVLNMVFLALAFAWMVRGCREGRIRPTVFGSLLLVALAAARYADLFESLVARGLVFVVVGSAIFAEGLVHARARRQAPGAAEDEGGLAA